MRGGGYYCKLNFICLIFLLLTELSYSQTPLFRVINPSVELDSVQLDLVTFQRTKDDYLSDYVVEVAHLNEVKNGNQITFFLPFDTTKFHTAKVIYYDYQDSLDYTWAGRLEENGGYLVLLHKPDGIIGFLQSPEYYYSIHPLGLEHAMLINRDLEYAEGFECSLDSLGFIQQSIDICDTDVNRCPAVIDVLSIVTDNAATWLNNNFGSIQIGSLTLNLTNLYLGLGYLTCNIALVNSAVPNKQFRFRTLFANIPLTTIITNDVNGMPNNDNILSWRDDYRADLVIALTNQNYGNTFGIVNEIGPNINHAFGITQIRFLGAPRFTLAHELAHLFGCRHNRPANGGNDNEDNCAHGFRFLDAERIERRTILAASLAISVEDPGGREMHFSNPDVFINGAASGTINDNNARVLRNVGCMIANYRAQPEWASVINAQEVVCRYEDSFTACAYIIEPGTGFPGVAPYTYSWHYSIDGNTNMYLGSTDCVIITPPSTGDIIYFYLTITSDDNQVMNLWKIVKVIDVEEPPCVIERPALTFGINQALYIKSKVLISPNPTEGLVVIKLLHDSTESQKTEFSIRVFNSQGRLIKVLKDVPGEENLINLNMLGLPAGQYFAEVFINNEFTYHKIIKL